MMSMKRVGILKALSKTLTQFLVFHCNWQILILGQIGMKVMNLGQLETFNYPKNRPLKKSVSFFLKGVDTFDKRSNINFTYRRPTRDQLQTRTGEKAKEEPSG